MVLIAARPDFFLIERHFPSVQGFSFRAYGAALTVMVEVVFVFNMLLSHMNILKIVIL